MTSSAAPDGPSIRVSGTQINLLDHKIELLKRTIKDLDQKVQRSTEFLSVASSKNNYKTQVNSLMEEHKTQVLQLKGLYAEQSKLETKDPKSAEIQTLVEKIQKKMNRVLHIENSIKSYKARKEELGSNWNGGIEAMRAEARRKEADAGDAIKALASLYAEKREVPSDWSEFSANFQTKLSSETADVFLKNGIVPNLSQHSNTPIFNRNLHQVLSAMLWHAKDSSIDKNLIAAQLMQNAALSPAYNHDALSKDIANALLGTKTVPLTDSSGIAYEVAKKMMDRCGKEEYTDFPTAELAQRFATICFDTGIIPQERPQGASCSPAYQSALSQIAQACVEKGQLKSFSGGSGLVIGGGNQQNALLVVLKPLAFEQISEKGGEVSEEDKIRHPLHQGGIVEHAVFSGPASDRPCTLTEVDFGRSVDPEMQKYGKQMCFVSAFVKNEGSIQDYHQLGALIAQKQGMIADKIGIKKSAPEGLVKINQQLKELDKKTIKTPQEQKIFDLLSANQKELEEGSSRIEETLTILNAELKDLEKKAERLKTKGSQLGFRTEDCELHEHPIFESCNPASVVMNGLRTLFYTNLDDNCENALIQLAQTKTGEPSIKGAVFKQIDVARALPRQLLKEPGGFTTTVAWEKTLPAQNPIPKEIKEFWKKIDVAQEEVRLQEIFSQNHADSNEECWVQFKIGAHFVKALVQTDASLQKGYEFMTAPDNNNPEHSRLYELYNNIQKSSNKKNLWTNFEKAVVKSLNDFSKIE